MLLQALCFVVHVRDGADSDSQHAVGGARDPPAIQLRLTSRVAEQGNCVVVSSADDERDLVLLLQLVELGGQWRKLV